MDKADLTYSQLIDTQDSIPHGTNQRNNAIGSEHWFNCVDPLSTENGSTKEHNNDENARRSNYTITKQ